MENSYSQLLTNIPSCVAEGPRAYHFLTERHVQAIWLEQKYFRNLLTVEGEPIRIISPGIWNADAGPDFKKAHIRIGNKEYFGDIEIHLMEDSWYQHHHHIDERYNQVVLHVTLWEPRVSKPILTQAQSSVFRTSLEKCLTIPHSRIAYLIDLDLYPYKKFVGSGKCAHNLFRSLSESKVINFFQKAADWRLIKKRSHLKSRIEDPNHLFPAGIAMALGYKNNAEAFLDLYLQIIQLNISKEEEILAILMASSGFFQETYQTKWSSSNHYKNLLDISKQLTLSPTPTIQLTFNKTRPLNHPLRRLVYLAKLISDQSTHSLFAKMSSNWSASWKFYAEKNKFGGLLQNFKEMLPHYQDSYWNFHYVFEDFPGIQYLPLLGDDLKKVILINVFLPLLEEEISSRGDHNEIKAFQAFYSIFPASNTSKTKYLVHRFFGDTIKGSVLKKAYIEQGAYQLHHDFCIHYESSCEGCPFVERYHTATAKI